jgi:hypothetical protein
LLLGWVCYWTPVPGTSPWWAVCKRVSGFTCCEQVCFLHVSTPLCLCPRRSACVHTALHVSLHAHRALHGDTAHALQHACQHPVACVGQILIAVDRLLVPSLPPPLAMPCGSLCGVEGRRVTEIVLVCSTGNGVQSAAQGVGPRHDRQLACCPAQ